MSVIASDLKNMLIGSLSRHSDPSPMYHIPGLGPQLFIMISLCENKYQIRTRVSRYLDSLSFASGGIYMANLKRQTDKALLLSVWGEQNCFCVFLLCLKYHVIERCGWELSPFQRWASNSQHWHKNQQILDSLFLIFSFLGPRKKIRWKQF